MEVHPWGFGFIDTPGKIAERIHAIGDLEGGFNEEMRKALIFLVTQNFDGKQLKCHVAGHEGHFVMNLEEIPEEDLAQMRQKEK